jgi:hypothetical protein
MRRLLLLLFLLPLGAQDLLIIHLSDEDARILQSLAEQKRIADFNWANAQKYLKWKYATEPGLAEAGNVKIEVRNPKHGFEYGIDFSQDYTTLAAKPKPCETSEP